MRGRIRLTIKEDYGSLSRKKVSNSTSSIRLNPRATNFSRADFIYFLTDHSAYISWVLVLLRVHGIKGGK